MEMLIWGPLQIEDHKVKQMKQKIEPWKHGDSNAPRTGVEGDLKEHSERLLKSFEEHHIKQNELVYSKCWCTEFK